MNYSLEQTLQQGLVLTQGMRQSLEMLQMDQLEVADYVKEQIEENFVIDLIEDTPERRALEELQKQYVWIRPLGYCSIAELSDDYNKNWDVLCGKAHQENVVDSLEFFLFDQLDRMKLSSQQCGICKYLVYLLDDRGFLKQDDIAYLHEIGFPKTEIDAALEELQKLDPPGIGARDLRECLSLQLRRLDGNHELEQMILEHYFEWLSAKRYQQIAKELKCTLKQIEKAVSVIQSLEPCPVSKFDSPEPTNYLSPDVFVIVEDGDYEIVFNDIYQPEISINPYYMKMMKETDDQETKNYLRERIRKAYELKEGLVQRKTTFYGCVKQIVEVQKDFFFEEHPLKPLTQAELAEKMGMHESTISRALRGKSLQTYFGTFPLKTFFSRALGEEGVSSNHVKNQIRKLLKEETPQKPLTDQKLVELLEEQGIQIPRRTVAKYRMELGFPSLSARRRSKNLKGQFEG